MITDSTGTVTSRHDYLPFGEEISVNIGGRTTAAGGQETVVNAAPGAYSDPRVPGGTAVIDLSIPANPAQAGILADVTVTAHVHPGGEILTPSGGSSSGGGVTVFGGTNTTRVADFGQSPSPADMRTAAAQGNNITHVVVGAKNHTAYIYNGSGVRATFTLKQFLSIGRK